MNKYSWKKNDKYQAGVNGDLPPRRAGFGGGLVSGMDRLWLLWRRASSSARQGIL